MNEREKGVKIQRVRERRIRDEGEEEKWDKKDNRGGDEIKKAR